MPGLRKIKRFVNFVILLKVILNVPQYLPSVPKKILRTDFPTCTSLMTIHHSIKIFPKLLFPSNQVSRFELLINLNNSWPLRDTINKIHKTYKSISNKEIILFVRRVKQRGNGQLSYQTCCGDD